MIKYKSKGLINRNVVQYKAVEVKLDSYYLILQKKQLRNCNMMFANNFYVIKPNIYPTYEAIQVIRDTQGRRGRLNNVSHELSFCFFKLGF